MFIRFPSAKLHNLTIFLPPLDRSYYLIQFPPVQSSGEFYPPQGIFSLHTPDKLLSPFLSSMFPRFEYNFCFSFLFLFHSCLSHTFPLMFVSYPVYLFLFTNASQVWKLRVRTVNAFKKKSRK